MVSHPPSRRWRGYPSHLPSFYLRSQVVDGASRETAEDGPKLFGDELPAGGLASGSESD